MRFVVVPLLLLAFSSMLGVCRFLGYVSLSGNPIGGKFYNGTSTSVSSNGSLNVGGNETELGFDVASVGMSAVIAAGVTALVVTSVALAVVSGITVFGSGLNAVSVMALFKSVAYFAIWGLFSVLALVMFNEVPLFGLPLYFTLTLFYSIGVVSSIGFMG
jgi:hypothetical protein